MCTQQTKEGGNMKHFILYIALLLFITACVNNKRTVPTQERRDTTTVGNDAYNTDNYESYNSDYSASCETINNSVNALETQKIQSNLNLKERPMSGREDAYEEGRSLAEEDRLNGTRMHEGDDYDDDYDDEGYDDDYDEGYDE